MIIQALVKRYEDTQEVPFGWQYRKVDFALNIDSDGKYLETVPIENNRKFKLPVVLVRSGINAYEKANFLCDDGGYLCGLDLKKFESAKKLHLELLANCNSPEAKAIKAYFSKGVQQFEDANAGKTYMFMVNGKFINYEIPELRQAWNDRPIESTDNTRCLVTGRLEPAEAIHGKI